MTTSRCNLLCSQLLVFAFLPMVHPVASLPVPGIWIPELEPFALSRSGQVVCNSTAWFAMQQVSLLPKHDFLQWSLIIGLGMDGDGDLGNPKGKSRHYGNSKTKDTWEYSKHIPANARTFVDNPSLAKAWMSPQNTKPVHSPTPGRFIWKSTFEKVANFPWKVQSSANEATSLQSATVTVIQLHTDL